ncbi:MAG: endopeptidase La [Anaerolineae bacterium]
MKPDEKKPNNERGSLTVPETLPVLPLKNTVIFPMTLQPLIVGQPRSIQLVDEVVVADRLVALVALKNEGAEEPMPDDVYRVGTMAVIHRLAKAPDGTTRLIIQGLERIRLLEFTQNMPYMRARVEAAPEETEEGLETEALTRNVSELFRKLVGLVSYLPEELAMAALSTEDPRQLVYMVATGVRMSLADAQQILEIDSLKGKLQKLSVVLAREVDVLELGKKIQSEAQGEMEKAQREYLLREQLKAIRRELGEEDEQQAEARELRSKIEAAGMPDEAKQEALKELDRLAKMPPAAAEHAVIRTYLGWLTELPWQKATEDHIDIAEARRVLDEDHYDLEKIKNRILEYLAVRKLRQERGSTATLSDGEEARDHVRREREGVILCFVGPPGTGKTSLGVSIARSMGRKFVRQSLGGVRDEAEIRGFRRTYVGSMPGRIIQAMRRVGTKNPVFMLDEIDKLGQDFHGDPSAALLEVLDPEQNREFRDHYLDVPFDLSQVMFITTANMLDTIPAPLRDRMEILQLAGYTEEEKLHIARGYLVPRQIRENSLRPEEVTFSEEALRRLVRDYTREAGVRNLEREIGTICRKVAARIAEGTGGPAVIGEDVTEYLGAPRYFHEVAERTVVPGVATGLSWTPTGGDILFVEATRMPGSKGFTLTGQLGEVMRESAQAALSYVRANATALGVPPDFFDKTDIHLHVPEGAIPKDGPSAGVTMATALASLLTGRPVRGDVGMTGEITLRGQVLPVGGIKEKVLAASRAGLRTVVLPRRNEKDLDDVPSEVRDKMQFVLVDRIAQVFEVALCDGQGEAAEGGSEDRPGTGQSVSQGG